MARPPSSFRLLPLPEEDTARPTTGLRHSSSFDINDGSDQGKLPRIHPHNARSSSSRADKRHQFRASSLTDVLELCELDKVEVVPGDSRKVHSSPKERKVSAPVNTIRKSESFSADFIRASEQNSIKENVSNAKAHKATAPARVDDEKQSVEGHDSKKSEKTREETQLQQLLETLKESYHADKSTIIDQLQSLYKFIEDNKSRKFLGKKKSDVIKIISGFVDTDIPDILILLVQILLSLQVRKQNLATAYKLVFKIAREADNDQCFITSDALDLLINSIALACPVNDSEALVYGYGALKFLTMNSLTREKLRSMGILDLVLLHLKLICEAKSERRVTDETSHVLFQLTGVIRNLVNDVDTQRKLVGMGGVSQVSRCLKLFMTDLDVVCNIARTVSVMSSDDEACAAIAEDPDFTSTAVSVLNKYPGRQDIVVRLTYCEYNIQY